MICFLLKKNLGLINKITFSQKKVNFFVFVRVAHKIENLCFKFCIFPLIIKKFIIIFLEFISNRISISYYTIRLSASIFFQPKYKKYFQES